LQTGLQAELLLDGDLVIDAYNSSENFKKDIKNDITPVDIGFIVGAGVQLTNGIGLTLILNQGLINIYEDTHEIYFDQHNNGFVSADTNGKILGVTINVSYLFGYAPKISK